MGTTGNRDVWIWRRSSWDLEPRSFPWREGGRWHQEGGLEDSPGYLGQEGGPVSSTIFFHLVHYNERIILYLRPFELQTMPRNSGHCKSTMVAMTFASRTPVSSIVASPLSSAYSLRILLDSFKNPSNFSPPGKTILLPAHSSQNIRQLHGHQNPCFLTWQTICS